MASHLDFDPLSDIKSFGDLKLFPNVSSELRKASIEDLIPKGYGKNPKIVGVYESGGTTGTPKRVVCMQDWLHYFVQWNNNSLKIHGFPVNSNWLGLIPSGPHIVGRLFLESARTYGKYAFTIDMDPRWVKTRIANHNHAEADAYAEHIINQAEAILKTQNVNVLAVTPALLERIVRKHDLVELINKKIKAIRWGGTQMHPQACEIYHDIFPSTILYGHYGNTMTLGIAGQRATNNKSPHCTFDSLSPYITFWVVDPSTKQPVNYGQRGRVLTHHISKAWFLPNNLERDVATRIKPQLNQVGDAVADIAPVERFEDETVIEGVY